ncbi:hypothetical protein ILYODFUR_029916 [Ilyodon furcidens]|uniref:Uncharacterized protein n=1 Tax=Ilyodon furcidens TaxID=33524 RepID=A0ABV0UK63_9TELE
MKESNPEPPASASCDSRIEEILEVLLLVFGKALLPPPEAPDSLRCQLVVLLHGLDETDGRTDGLNNRIGNTVWKYKHFQILLYLFSMPLLSMPFQNTGIKCHTFTNCVRSLNIFCTSTCFGGKHI